MIDNPGDAGALHRTRAPGAEKRLIPHPRPVNPNNLARLDDASVAAVLAAAADRAIEDTVTRPVAPWAPGTGRDGYDLDERRR